MLLGRDAATSAEMLGRCRSLLQTCQSRRQPSRRVKSMHCHARISTARSRLHSKRRALLQPGQRPLQKLRRPRQTRQSSAGSISLRRQQQLTHFLHCQASSLLRRSLRERCMSCRSLMRNVRHRSMPKSSLRTHRQPNPLNTLRIRQRTQRLLNTAQTRQRTQRLRNVASSSSSSRQPTPQPRSASADPSADASQQWPRCAWQSLMSWHTRGVTAFHGRVHL